MKDYLSQFEENGFFVVKDALSEDQTTRYRNLCEHYFDNHPTNSFMDGFVCNGWAGITPELEELNQMHEQDVLLKLANLTLGDDFVYTGHSDLHKNIVTFWHRDYIDYNLGDPKSKAFKNPETNTFGGFDETDFWKDADYSALPNIEKYPAGFWDDGHRIIKVAILLQDHTENEFGLWVMSGSHKEGVVGEKTYLKTTARDIVVFDHRITHRGQSNDPQYHHEHDHGRMFLCWGYGLDNKYTNQFSIGTNDRQQFYRKKMLTKQQRVEMVS